MVGGLRCAVTFANFHLNRLRGYDAVESKMALPHYFGQCQWLIQQQHDMY